MIRNKLMPWRIAQARIAFVDMFTMPMRFSKDYWNTWTSVMYPEPSK